MFKTVAALERVCVTIWVGGMLAVAVTVFMLFNKIADRSLAGEVAGSLFATLNFVGIVCAAVLIVIFLKYRRLTTHKHWRLWVLALMLIVIAVSQWGIRPKMDALIALQLTEQEPIKHENYRKQFARLHAGAGSLYLINCILGMSLVVAGQFVKESNAHV